MSKFTQSLLAAAALAASINVNAAIVDHGAYLSDTSTGLDWLDVTTSVGISYNDVKAQFGVGGQFEGWRYATGVELNGLIGSYTGTTPVTMGEVSQEVDKIDGLVVMLGSTLDSPYLDVYGETYTEHFGLSELTHFRYTEGYISDLKDADSVYISILFDNDSIQQNVGDFSEIYYSALGTNASTTSLTQIGSFLVRASAVEPPVATVPEPSTFALLGLGLLGALRVRRRSQK